MNQASFEFPLNEKVRNYLRVEQMFSTLADPEICCQKHIELSFLRNLINLLDLIERVDLRTEMLRDLDAYFKNIEYWQTLPNVSESKLSAEARVVTELTRTLDSEGRIGSSLKHDRFLSTIRQRFTIPGGTCSFDLPQLHFWLNQPDTIKSQYMRDWLAPLTVLKDALTIVLKFIRQRQPFVDIVAHNGFYQGVANAKFELIRIEYNAGLNLYPTLSGNKYRYSIKFLPFDDDILPQNHNNSEIVCKLANC